MIRQSINWPGEALAVEVIALEQDVPQRVHYLDWMRILATITLFLFHTAYFIVDRPVDYKIRAGQPNYALTIFVIFIHAWIMPLFFLIAGMGSSYAFKHRQWRRYISERFKRLAVPYMFGVILLIPVQAYLENLLVSGSGRSFWEAYINRFIMRQYPVGPQIFGELGFYLWFLAFLFLYSVIAVPIFLFLESEPGRKFISKIANIGEKPLGPYLVVLPVISCNALKLKFPEYEGGGTLYAGFVFLYTATLLPLMNVLYPCLVNGGTTLSAPALYARPAFSRHLAAVIWSHGFSIQVGLRHTLFSC